MNRIKSLLPWVVVATVVVALAVQFNSTRQLRSEVAQLRHQFTESESQSANVSLDHSPAKQDQVVTADVRLAQRLAELEKTVAQFTHAAEYLMDRGQIPLSENKLADVRRRFADPALADRDRLRALQMLRRNGPIPDEVAAQAVAWLQTATNSGTQRSLLQQLDGATNAVLKQPLLGLVSAGDSRLRAAAVDALGSFTGDPQVMERLWDILGSDPDKNVREEAQRALRQATLSNSQLTDLQRRAADPQASLPARLTALRLLDAARADTSAATASLADLAQNTTDAALRRELFRAFDRINDPVVKLPLVHGLQDPNPLVRERAVDALADFRSDPAVGRWLEYVSQNDADPQVRREAFEALMDD